MPALAPTPSIGASACRGAAAPLITPFTEAAYRAPGGCDVMRFAPVSAVPSAAVDPTNDGHAAADHAVPTWSRWPVLDVTPSPAEDTATNGAATRHRAARNSERRIAELNSRPDLQAVRLFM